MKKYISLLIASALAMSTTAISFGADFSDIADVPWPGAETYINQAADSGLMVGEEVDGKKVFRAKDPVTLVETAQLVYNVLKTSGHLDEALANAETKWTPSMTTAGIPSWAYASVSYCLEKGIISEADMKSFVSNGTNVEATREQVAGMIGKAIASVDSSITTTATTTKFSDTASITADKVPYVALLSEKSILSGDDLGNFNPQNKINRTEMAVMITKSNDVLKTVTVEPELPTTGTFTADIEQIQAMGSNIMLALNNGQGVMGYMGDDTVPTTYQDGTAGKFSDAALYTSVTVTYDGSRITKMVINTAAPVVEEKEDQVLEGKIASLDKEEIRLSKGLPYYISDDVEITIDGKDKKLKDLLDAMDDEDITEVNATLTLDAKEDVIKIVAKTTEKSYEASGTIKKFNESKITFENGDSYQIDEDDIIVKYDGSTISLESAVDKVTDSNKTFTADVEIDEDDDDYVTRIEIKSGKSSSGSGEGEVDSVDGKKLKVDGETYTVPSGADIDIDDGEETIKSMNDLETAVEDDDKIVEVEVTVKNDEVTKITGQVTSVTGDLYSVEDDNVVLDLDSGKYIYPCKSNVSIDVDDSDVDDLDELDDYLRDEGDIRVELTINSDNKVTKIEEK